MTVDYEKYKPNWDKWAKIGRPSIPVDAMLEAMEEAIPHVIYGRTEIVIAAEKLYIKPFDIMEKFARLQKGDPRYLRYQKIIRGEGYLLEPKKVSRRVKSWASDKYAVAYLENGEECWVQTEFSKNEAERIVAMLNDYYESLNCQKHKYFVSRIE